MSIKPKFAVFVSVEVGLVFSAAKSGNAFMDQRLNRRGANATQMQYLQHP